MAENKNPDPLTFLVAVFGIPIIMGTLLSAMYYYEMTTHPDKYPVAAIEQLPITMVFLIGFHVLILIIGIILAYNVSKQSDSKIESMRCYDCENHIMQADPKYPILCTFFKPTEEDTKRRGSHYVEIPYRSEYIEGNRAENCRGFMLKK